MSFISRQSQPSSPLFLPTPNHPNAFPNHRFDHFPPDLLDFYRAFSSVRHFEAYEIEGFKYEQGPNGTFVSYIIHVRTRDVDYRLNRRYSEFFELYNEVIRNHKDISICNFPEKKWFGNLTESVIRGRIIKLNEFLRQLVMNCRRFEFYEVLNFLALEKSYEYFGFDLKTFEFEKIKSQAANKDEEEILDLFIKLNLNDTNLSKAFEDFEFMLFEKKIHISMKIVEILLLGDYELKGLLEICGKTDNSSHFACNAGLKFLCSLLNHENNPAAENFLKVFVGCHLKQLGRLNLSSHILLTPSRKCKNYALILLKIYLDNNPNVSPYLIETALESQEAYIEFINWKKTHHMFSQRTEGYDVDNHSDGVCNPEASMILEEINFFSATFKQLKSPLFRKKNNSSFKYRASMFRKALQT